VKRKSPSAVAYQQSARKGNELEKNQKKNWKKDPRLERLIRKGGGEGRKRTQACDGWKEKKVTFGEGGQTLKLAPTNGGKKSYWGGKFLYESGYGASSLQYVEGTRTERPVSASNGGKMRPAKEGGARIDRSLGALWQESGVGGKISPGF